MGKLQKFIQRQSNKFPIGFGVTMFVNMIFYAMVSTVLFSFLPKMVKYFGASEVETGYKAGVIATSFYIGQFVFSMAWGYAADTMQLKHALILAGSCLSITTILFGLSRTFYWAFISRFLQGSSMGHLIIFKALINVVCEEKNVAFGLSLMMSAFTVGSIVGPSIGGFLAFPADQYPRLISHENLLGKFGILLTNLVLVVGVVVGILLVLIFIPKNKKDNSKKSNDKNQKAMNLDPLCDCDSITKKTPSFTEVIKEGYLEQDIAQVKMCTQHVNVGYSKDAIESHAINNDTSKCNARIGDAIKFDTINGDADNNDAINGNAINGVEINGDAINSNVINGDLINNETSRGEVIIGVAINSDTSDVINRDTITGDDNSKFNSVTSESDAIYDDAKRKEAFIDDEVYIGAVIDDAVAIDETNNDTLKNYAIKSNTIINDNTVTKIDPINGEFNAPVTDTSVALTMTEVSVDQVNREFNAPVTNQDTQTSDIDDIKSGFVSIKSSKLGQVLQTRNALLSVFLYMLFSMLDIGFSEILPVLTSTSITYRGMNMTPSQLGTLLLIAPTCYFIPQVIFGPKFIGRFGAKFSFISLNLVMAFSYAILPIMAAIHGRTVLNICLIALIIVIRVSAFGCFVAANMLVNNSVPPNLLGTINGVASSATALGRLIAPILFGSIYSWSLTNIVGVRGNAHSLGFPFNQFFTFFVLALCSIFIAVITTLLPGSIKEKK